MNYELVESLRRHEKWAQEQLYSKYADRFIGYVLNKRKSLNRMDAQEISHNAFLHIFKYIATFSGTKPFDSWMYSILHNAMNHYINRSIKAVSKITCKPLENFSQSAFKSITIDLNELDYEIKQKLIKETLDKEMHSEYSLKKYAYFICNMYYRGYNCRDIAEYYNVNIKHLHSVKREADKHIKKLINI